MIDLYWWGTPNGRKVSIMLEEVGLPYQAHHVDIGSGDQYKQAFLEISPNNKIPAIVDPDGPDGKPISVFESGAILIYLAEKTGQFLPSEPRARLDVLQWLMFQMGGVGPMFGQANHFIKFAREEVPYAVERYRAEAMRLLGVINTRLADVDYLAGEYSIADIATWPWVMRAEWYDTNWDDFPNTKRWYDTIGERPAVQRGVEVE
ncbi:MAG: glutathione S-transferase N-terminal domain-containing protein [Pseudomonadota bacterium]